MQIHESSYIDEGVEIGEGTKIWHFCHIMTGAKIGKNCVIGQGCFIGKNVIIGNGCKIQNNVSIFEGVTIEDDVFIGPSVVFTNVVNPRAFIERKDEYRKTLIKKGATIGANSTIICEVTIGEYCLIGAGSIVTKDIKEYSVSFGHPAIEKGRINKEGDIWNLYYPVVNLWGIS
jgi:UDP-2-acetamido-3-amino-2,3-dideoxy-glucuronate N-acetyltransferase